MFVELDVNELIDLLVSCVAPPNDPLHEDLWITPEF